MISDTNENRYLNSQLMPGIASKYRSNQIHVRMGKQIGRENPIINQLLADEKPTNLCYNPDYNAVSKRLDVQIPKFQNTMARRSILSGMKTN